MGVGAASFLTLALDRAFRKSGGLEDYANAAMAVLGAKA